MTGATMTGESGTGESGGEESGHVLSSMTGAVAHIRLNRPERLNALSFAMLERLRTEIETAPDKGARAILLSAQGRAFCAGADLSGQAGQRDAGEKLREHYHPVARAMQHSRIPIVCALRGTATGGGAGIALLSDIVVMERMAGISFVFARIGLVPDVGAAWLLAQSVGRARALDLLLFGDRMTGEDARAAGLVSRLVEEGEALPHAQALAERLAGMPSVALGMIRRQVNQALGADLDTALEVEAVYQSRASATEDFREGVRAFREKRPPLFMGR